MTETDSTNSPVDEPKISVIVPTIGRPESLKRLLDSLTSQSRKPDEVIVADGGNNQDVANLLAQPYWKTHELILRHIWVLPPNAVRQRNAAISASAGELLLLLDDDVVLEPLCVERMCELLMRNPDVVAVSADFNNESWPRPTRLWRMYMRIFHGINGSDDGAWQGKIVGPLLRFGYSPSPLDPEPMDWLGTCNSLVRREAFDRVGGFSDFFLHRCTMNEDVDLGIKLRREGVILLCPSARLGHFHAPSGRLAPVIVAEDDLYNRYMIMRRTLLYSRIRSFALVCVYFIVESGSDVLGALRRLEYSFFRAHVAGRFRAITRIVFHRQEPL